MTDPSSTEILNRWVDVARWAPSGGNAQNWRVTDTSVGETIGARIALADAVGASWSVMDAEGVPSIMALGGFEFALIAAAANDGYMLKSRKFIEGPTRAEGRFELEFVRAPEVNRSYSNEEIRNRRTDRRPYQRRSISVDAVNAFEKIVSRYRRLGMKMFSNDTRPSKVELISIFSVIERLRWQHKALLESLLQEIAFGREIKTLEDRIASDQLGVSRAEQLMLHALQKWRPLRALLKLGFHALAVRRAVTAFVRDCDRVCFLSLEKAGEPSFEEAVEIGTCLQEIWLEAHRRGISFQPLGLPLIAFCHSNQPQLLLLSEAQVQDMNGVRESFKADFGLDLSALSIGFRLGYPKDPDAKLAPSHRRHINIVSK